MGTCLCPRKGEISGNFCPDKGEKNNSCNIHIFTYVGIPHKVRVFVCVCVCVCVCFSYEYEHVYRNAIAVNLVADK